MIAPVMGVPGEKGALLSEFAFSDTGAVIACPEGLKPLKARKAFNEPLGSLAGTISQLLSGVKELFTIIGFIKAVLM